MYRQDKTITVILNNLTVNIDEEDLKYGNTYLEVE